MLILKKNEDDILTKMYFANTVKHLNTIISSEEFIDQVIYSAHFANLYYLVEVPPNPDDKRRYPHILKEHTPSVWPILDLTLPTAQCHEYFRRAIIALWKVSSEASSGSSLLCQWDESIGTVDAD